MNAKLTAKIAELLSLDSPANYECWEDAEEGLFDELTEEETEEYTSSGESPVEEWFAANEGDEDEDQDA